jgi:hypothetical protein
MMRLGRLGRLDRWVAVEADVAGILMSNASKTSWLYLHISVHVVAA